MHTSQIHTARPSCAVATDTVKTLQTIDQLVSGALNLGPIVFRPEFTEKVEGVEAVHLRLTTLAMPPPPNSPEAKQLRENQRWESEGLNRLKESRKEALAALINCIEYLDCRARDLGLQILIPEQKLQRVNDLVKGLHLQADVLDPFGSAVATIRDTKDDILHALRDVNRSINVELTGLVRVPLQEAAQQAKDLLDRWETAKSGLTDTPRTQNALRNLCEVQSRLEEVATLFGESGFSAPDSWLLEFHRPENPLRLASESLSSIIAECRG